jgi:hypothetical protein
MVSFLKYLSWQAMHFENMLQTIEYFKIPCIRAPFSWLEKARNCMGQDLDCMVDVLMRLC